jgi:hypothetical protein
MEACPACTASMRDGLLHCESQECIWLKCGKCGVTLGDDGSYFGAGIWGNEDGYLKADG